jgi:hypothetical protein
MPPIWTPPRTYTTGEIVTAAMLNAHVRDNLELLKLRVDTPLNAFSQVGSPSYSTASTAFVDIDPAVYSITLNIVGGLTLLSFTGSFRVTAAPADACFDLSIDGARIGTASFGSLVHQVQTANAWIPISFSQLRNITPGLRTFRLQWRVSTGSLQIGSANPINFHVMELIGAR